MLNRLRAGSRHLLPILACAAGVLLGGCEQPSPTIQGPVAIEATYRLQFNDQLVGEALFTLEVDADGGYHIEAFTVPAGEMRERGAHEVLESSDGQIVADEVRPLRFEHSVMRDGALTLAALSFDWDRQQLEVSGPDGSERLGLHSGTQDRLSYLLAAYQLAAAGGAPRDLRLASLQASEATRLTVTGNQTIDVPLGSYPAVAIQRVDGDPAQSRQLWYAPDVAPLPLRVLQQRDGNLVDMQLVALSRRPNGPR